MDAPQDMRGTTLRTPQMLPFPFDVVQVAFGSEHFAIVTASGGLYTAGSNYRAQLGRVDAGCTLLHTLAPVQLPPGAAESVACGERNTLLV